MSGPRQGEGLLRRQEVEPQKSFSIGATSQSVNRLGRIAAQGVLAHEAHVPTEFSPTIRVRGVQAAGSRYHPGYETERK